MTDMMTSPHLDPNRDAFFARHLERVQAATIFGPQLDSNRFRTLCARGLQQEHFHPDIRVELNHFALWAPESVWREIMRIVVAPQDEPDTGGYRGFESRQAYEEYYSDPANYAAEMEAMEQYTREAEQEREEEE